MIDSPLRASTPKGKILWCYRKIKLDRGERGGGKKKRNMVCSKPFIPLCCMSPPGQSIYRPVFRIRPLSMRHSPLQADRSASSFALTILWRMNDRHHPRTPRRAIWPTLLLVFDPLINGRQHCLFRYALRTLIFFLWRIPNRPYYFIPSRWSNYRTFSFSLLPWSCLVARQHPYYFNGSSVEMFPQVPLLPMVL